MIINWIAEKARHFLAVQDAGFDELSVHFDFALSAEIIGLLYAKNAADRHDREGDKSMTAQSSLDEHEQALA